MLALLFLLLAGATYAGLVWYPQRAAAELMRPASQEFAAALATYRTAVAGFPPGHTDPQALVDRSSVVVGPIGQAREELGRASTRLEDREPVSWPIVSSRPALAQARSTRNVMLSLYVSALETLAVLEGVAGYVTQVAGVLPQLDNLAQTLGRPAPDDIGPALAASTPIADQVLADLNAVTPREEMGGLHAGLLAIAARIRGDLGDIGRAGQAGTEPVVRALIQDIGAEIASFRETLGRAPRDARDAGLADREARVDRLAAQAVAGLEALRDIHGITGLTFPPPAAPETGV